MNYPALKRRVSLAGKYIFTTALHPCCKTAGYSRLVKIKRAEIKAEATNKSKNRVLARSGLKLPSLEAF